MHLKKVELHPERYPVLNAYPFNIPALQQPFFIEFSSPVTLLVGENGCGKSTFLEGLTTACGIHIWRNRDRSRPGHNPHEADFHRALSVEWEDGRVAGSFFGSDIFRNFAELLDEWASSDEGQLDYFGGKSLTVQSHGQSLMSFFSSRYRVRGLYMLDEPETALSPRTQIDFLNLVLEMSGKGHAQFVIATHSPILLACPGAALYSFDRTPPDRIGYEETEHFRIYRNFMLDPDRYLSNRKKQDG